MNALWAGLIDECVAIMSWGFSFNAVGVWLCCIGGVA